MNRREFTRILGIGAVALGVPRIGGSSSTQPQFSITMDDFAWHNAVHLTAEGRNRAILDVLSANRAKAALFVVGGMVDSEERGKKLLRFWDETGHIIGNHTYSHRSLNSTITAAEYEQDISRAEEVLKEFKQFRRIFRYPALKEGNTPAKRDHVRAFLKQHGYRIGHVTIDNSDWIIDQRLAARLQKDPRADVKPYRDFYLAHMWDRAQYYDSLAKQVLGRPVKHTILMHFNLLNGLFLGNLIEMFKSKGWQLIDAEEAFTDPVFRAEPKIVPAGESVVWALAKEAGKIPMSLRYPAEDGEYEKAKMDKLGL
ncbi:MAG TPA: polysaccharide deacetylase family protein [Pyrinomonadaceae bacterium]|nr:polysaccharide deacetylase family protein [Pyrinomonadaceae bacterium]